MKPHPYHTPSPNGDSCNQPADENTIRPRCARELHLIPWLRQDLLLRSKVNTLKPVYD